MRTHCDKCQKKTTETWDGWCQDCIDKHAIEQESEELIEDTQ